MYPLLRWRRKRLAGVLIPVLISTCFAVVTYADNYTWEDCRLPFKQAFRFSTAATAVVRVTIPTGILTASDRIPMIYRMDKNSPRLRPYLIVNNNRRAFYYLGGSGMVNIRSDHLRAGENEFFFGDQTTTGDLIFIHELGFQLP